MIEMPLFGEAFSEQDFFFLVLCFFGEQPFSFVLSTFFYFYF